MNDFLDDDPDDDSYDPDMDVQEALRLDLIFVVSDPLPHRPACHADGPEMPTGLYGGITNQLCARKKGHQGPHAFLVVYDEGYVDKERRVQKRSEQFQTAEAKLMDMNSAMKSAVESLSKLKLGVHSNPEPRFK